MRPATQTIKGKAEVAQFLRIGEPQADAGAKIGGRSVKLGQSEPPRVNRMSEEWLRKQNLVTLTGYLYERGELVDRTGEVDAAEQAEIATTKKLLGDMPARMVDVLTNEMPSALAGEAANPGAVAKVFDKLVEIAKGAATNPNDALAIVANILNMLALTGQMEPGALKEIVGKLPADKRQALSKACAYETSPLGEAFSQGAAKSKETFGIKARELLAAQPGKADPKLKADAMIEAARSYNRLKEYAAQADPARPFEEQFPVEAALGKDLEVHLGTLADKAWLDQLDLKRLLQLKEALRSLGVNRSAEIGEVVAKHREAARAECRLQLKAACQQAVARNAAGYLAALNKAGAAEADARDAQRYLSGSNAPHDKWLTEAVADARKVLPAADLPLSGMCMDATMDSLSTAAGGLGKSGAAQDIELAKAINGTTGMHARLMRPRPIEPGDKPDTDAIRQTFGIDMQIDANWARHLGHACDAGATAPATLPGFLAQTVTAMSGYERACRVNGKAFTPAHWAQTVQSEVGLAVERMDQPSRRHLQAFLCGKEGRALEEELRTAGATNPQAVASADLLAALREELAAQGVGKADAAVPVHTRANMRPALREALEEVFGIAADPPAGSVATLAQRDAMRGMVEHVTQRLPAPQQPNAEVTYHSALGGNTEADVVGGNPALRDAVRNLTTVGVAKHVGDTMFRLPDGKEGTLDGDKRTAFEVRSDGKGGAVVRCTLSLHGATEFVAADGRRVALKPPGNSTMSYEVAVAADGSAKLVEPLARPVIAVLEPPETIDEARKNPETLKAFRHFTGQGADSTAQFVLDYEVAAAKNMHVASPALKSMYLDEGPRRIPQASIDRLPDGVKTALNRDENLPPPEGRMQALTGEPWTSALDSAYADFVKQQKAASTP